MVYVTPEAMGAGLGLAHESVADMIENFDFGGHVHREGDAIALSEDVMRTHGIRLTDGEYRWVKPEYDAPAPAGRVNTRLAAASKDDWVGELRCDKDGLPQPSVLLGSGMIWDNAGHAICPACGHKPLQPHVYCLYCDRWGLDDVDAPASGTQSVFSRTSTDA